MTIRFPLLTVLALVLLGAARAPASPDFSAGMLDRQEALSVEATTNVYPDAETVLLSGMQRVFYNADGTYEQWNEEYVKILTEEGRQASRTLSSYFTIPYQRGPEDCRIARVEIIRGDGTTECVDVDKQSRIMVDPSSMADNIYNPNEKIIQLNVAGLAVGDVLHYVFFDRIVQPRMRDTWCDWYVLESTRPIVRQTIEVEGPSERPLARVALKGAITNTVTHTREEREGGRVLDRWEVRNVPRMFPEPNMPELPTVVQRLLVSTAPDWEFVSRWYSRLSEPHLAPSDEIRAKVSELTGGRTNDPAVVEALFHFVAQEIRYMGTIAESQSPGYEPHDVRSTFADRHGVCRDKAALLVAMLRVAGMEAFPTLIHSGPKKDSEVPQPYFNHAIVALRQGGTYQLMDPTDETSKELLPSYLDNRSYLVATPEGDPLRTSPIAPATNNLMRIETSAYLGADGRLSAESVFTFEGINDNVYRQYLAQAQPVERRRLLEGVIKTAVPNARILEADFTPANMLDVATGLSARVVYEADDILVRGGQLGMLPLPMVGTRLGMVNFIVGQTGLRERRFPLVTDVACGVREHLHLELDPALDTPVSLPATEPVDRGTVAWSLAVHQSKATLDASSEFRLEAVEFSPDQYLGLKATLVDMERGLRKMPVYALAGTSSSELAAGSDVLIESDNVDYTLKPDGTLQEDRTVRKRVLNYAGVKRHSELSIRFNPAWDEATLVSGNVTAPDGKVSAISPGEQNVMDAAWVGSARRYPAERTLVASFPAVQVGSTIEYHYIVTRRDRPLQSIRECFRGVDAIVHKRVTLHVPRGTVPSVHRSNLDSGGVQEIQFAGGAGDADVYQWEAGNVPAIEREEGLPPDWAFNPTVSISFGTWGAYAAQVDRVLRRAAAHQPKAAELAETVTHGLVDPWERMRAIRDAVAMRVRSAGPALADLPLTSVTDADRTLADGYGNQTDRAVLLYAMLRAAGFQPAFVAASRRPAIEPFRAPLDGAAAAGVFGDVLVRVAVKELELADERAVYLGDGDQYDAVGASSHAGMWALVLPSGRLEPVLPARDDGAWNEYTMTVAENGDTVLTQRSLLYGAVFGSENRRYAQMTPEERRRHHQEMLARFSQAAEPVGDLQTDFSSYPGRVSFSVRLPLYAVRDGRYLYLQLPDTLENVFVLRADRRENPLYLEAQGVAQTRFAINLPPGFDLVMRPPEQRLSGLAGAQIEVSVSLAETGPGGGVSLLALSEVTRQPALVPAADYPTLLEWDRALSHRRARMIVLRQHEDEPAPAEAATPVSAPATRAP